MTRRALFVGLFCAPVPALIAAQSISGDELLTLAMALERPWNLFIRKLTGCPYPNGETNEQTCTKPAEVDTKSFARAGEAAKKLWKA